ncbi:hypothetical protein Sliba_19500 [Streptomyces nigrescens]|uniref:Uncharacterized protein n=1 Tax=Streptomyces nigrescens TaxID=1920 RepID=A0A640TCR5_STRNI|nr:hypothetical protein Sliba_19500 [Streptomyces libani subsp. libani]GGW02045.1 hypothetical protein GCM10010500_58510 [Streptomyces libani subsp. libani]
MADEVQGRGREDLLVAVARRREDPDAVCQCAGGHQVLLIGKRSEGRPETVARPSPGHGPERQAPEGGLGGDTSY